MIQGEILHLQRNAPSPRIINSSGPFAAIPCFYRAQIEEEYGERLLKLSQQTLGTVEQGSFSESLTQIPSAMEATARAHLDLAEKLKKFLEFPLTGFVRDQKDTRKAVSLSLMIFTYTTSEQRLTSSVEFVSCREKSSVKRAAHGQCCQGRLTNIYNCRSIMLRI